MLVEDSLELCHVKSILIDSSGFDQRHRIDSIFFFYQNITIAAVSISKRKAKLDYQKNRPVIKCVRINTTSNKFKICASKSNYQQDTWGSVWYPRCQLTTSWLLDTHQVLHCKSPQIIRTLQKPA
ncbi:uncharacterized protein KLLA0_E17249g [Kluyveromyces lactis]|uniref:KLLA0E17249p n=1 Tax=Kluyveromyces lactis (strain ATCC 8585 / CBS 2359 / DSM 70799 / NBRC 1267 / NRRL Y-1140 / WM37) TaxID=284590 RepID=Q6CMW2_KLULA|nr:uncharacterized protein KLLA0_E17249g [Kluyveromyces lactis]CAG99814.1 KLLA0E17249p [Kluyveromyces lactis]|eukprot:XP_454727.1 uncharacterized protein KLLA0_E17249g [Kluyveromyces lactis]